MVQGNTVRFEMGQSCADSQGMRDIRAALEKEGALTQMELRRYHTSGLANFRKGFLRALFVRKYASQKLVTDGGIELTIKAASGMCLFYFVP
jgi:hypothetical protein